VGRDGDGMVALRRSSPLFWSEAGLEVVKSDDIRCRVSASLCDRVSDIFDAPVRDVGTNGEEWFTIVTKDSGL
jgi:hypothetical protein